MKAFAWLALIVGTLASSQTVAANSIVVGSKIFTEGYVLGEIAAQTIAARLMCIPITPGPWPKPS